MFLDHVDSNVFSLDVSSTMYSELLNCELSSLDLIDSELSERILECLDNYDTQSSSFRSSNSNYENDCDDIPQELQTSQGQFVHALMCSLNRERFPSLHLNEDAFLYFVNISLPSNMEMWYNWSTIEGDELLREAKAILDEFGVYYPY